MRVVIDRERSGEYLAEVAGYDWARRASAHDDEVILAVRHASGHGSTTRILQVALGPDEHLEQTHEQHERGATTSARKRRPRLSHRAVAVHLQYNK